MRQSVGVSDVAMKGQSRCGDQTGVREWRSICASDVAMFWPSRCGYQLAFRKWVNQLACSEVAIKWRAESGIQLACQKWRSIGFTKCGDHLTCSEWR